MNAIEYKAVAVAGLTLLVTAAIAQVRFAAPVGGAVRSIIASMAFALSGYVVARRWPVVSAFVRGAAVLASLLVVGGCALAIAIGSPEWMPFLVRLSYALFAAATLFIFLPRERSRTAALAAAVVLVVSSLVVAGWTLHLAREDEEFHRAGMEVWR
jgi:hypothetical protein